MEGSVGVTCAGCGVSIIVMSAKLLEAIGDSHGLEGEAQFVEYLAGAKAATGSRLAVVDAERIYTCPECGTRAALPPPEELFTD